MQNPDNQQLAQRFLDAEGVLIQWPSKETAKLAVLEYLASKFSLDRVYTESEVNDILCRWHSFEDWALLRRELFDRYYFDREPNGSDYRRRV